MSHSWIARYGRRARVLQLPLAIVSLAAWPTAACAAPPSPAPLIWAFGDSLTAGYGLPPAQGFVPHLQAALRRSGIAATVKNGGIAGDTAAQARARLLWGLRGLGRRPDLVIVELGANDMLRGLPVAQAKANLDMIVTTLQSRHIPVVLAGMRAAPNLGPDYARAFDAIYPGIAKDRAVPLYPFFLDGVAGHRELIQADGLHPNARGVAVIVARIAPLLRKTLRSVGQR